ncbi:retrovirus-related pol polyprotein from transposon TNT 1-94 [Tanacetum coccineum]
MKKAFQDMLHGLGEVNPTHAYYNDSRTSKDNEDPSCSTRFKTRRTQKTSSALEALLKTLYALLLYLLGILYDRLKAFFLDHMYTMGLVDNTLFTKKKDLHIIIVQIYVNDIISRSTCQDLCDDFSKIMHDEFEMSMMGELDFFLGLQIKQLEDGIFFNQSKYIKEMLKKFDLDDSKPIKTPMSSETKLTRDEDEEFIDDTKYRGMIEVPKTSHLEAIKRIFRYIKGTTHLELWYPKGTRVETNVYANSNHAGDYVDRKSISGVCTFMGCCLTLWFSKKQTALAISTTEAGYVSIRKAYQQALWMKQALVDYDINLDEVVRNNGGCNDDGGMKIVVRSIGEGGQEVVVSVGWQRLGDEDDGDVVVVVVSNGGGCGGACVQSSFKDLDSPEDDPVIVVDDSDEDEKDESQKHKLELEKNKDEVEVALLKAQPSFPNVGQLNELLVKSLHTKFSNILYARDFSSSLPTELKDLPTKFNELTKEVKGLKTHVHNLEIELPGDLKVLASKY